MSAPAYVAIWKTADLYARYRLTEIALKADYNEATYDAEMAAYIELDRHLDDNALFGSIFDPWAATR